MKTFFLVLVIFKGSASLEYVKIPITTPITFEDFYCDQAFEKNARWIDNPKYKDGNGEVWGYFIYNNKMVVAHYCIDQHGNYIL